MSSLVVRVPECLCEVARVRVRVGDRSGPANVPFGVSAGSAVVAVDVSVARDGFWAEGSVEVPVDLPAGGAVEIAPLLAPSRSSSLRPGPNE